MNLALTGMIAQCQVGATILALCEFGHAVITAGVSKLYTKKINAVVDGAGVPDVTQALQTGTGLNLKRIAARALENGARIRVVLTDDLSPGVDTEEQARAIEKHLLSQ